MIIGTVRQVFNSMAGYHQFHAEETQEPYGSFEVFWYADGEKNGDEDCPPGWYWWSCFPGCMPDSAKSGPFASSMQAHKDADEWSPEYDE
jgi:hypothetical protein